MINVEECNVQGFEALRAAVVERACLDYLMCLKTPGKKFHYATKNGRKQFDNERTIRRWFHSKEFRNWCHVDGETILAQLRENHKNGIRLYTDEMLGE